MIMILLYSNSNDSDDSDNSNSNSNSSSSSSSNDNLRPVAKGDAPCSVEGLAVTFRTTVGFLESNILEYNRI